MIFRHVEGFEGVPIPLDFGIAHARETDARKNVRDRRNGVGDEMEMSFGRARAGCREIDPLFGSELAKLLGFKLFFAFGECAIDRNLHFVGEFAHRGTLVRSQTGHPLHKGGHGAFASEVFDFRSLKFSCIFRFGKGRNRFGLKPFKLLFHTGTLRETAIFVIFLASRHVRMPASPYSTPAEAGVHSQNPYVLRVYLGQ